MISFAQKLENPIWALSILSNNSLNQWPSFVVFTNTSMKTLTENDIPTDWFETDVCCEHSDVTAASGL